MDPGDPMMLLVLFGLLVLFSLVLQFIKRVRPSRSANNGRKPRE